MAETVSVYREQGSDPPGTTVGGLVLGVVHHGIDATFARETLVAKKHFRIVPRDPKNATTTAPTSTTSTSTTTNPDQKPEGAAVTSRG